MNVASLRKVRVVLERRSPSSKGDAFDGSGVDNEVGIAHADGRQPKFLAGEIIQVVE
jgi:hypothetical protein